MNQVEEKIKRIEAVYYGLRTKGIVTTWTDFAEKVGVAKSTISAAKNGNEKALTDSLMKKIEAFVDSVESPRITINNGYGKNISNNIATGGSTINTTTEPQIIRTEDSQDMVPVIPQKLYKDPETSVLEYLEEGHKDIQMAQAIDQFGAITCYKFCNSDAMYPDIRPGDLLALRAVDRDAPIVNGETYVIEVWGVGLMIRVVDDISESEVLLTALNDNKYGAMKLKKEKIVTLFRIIGYTRTNI